MMYLGTIMKLKSGKALVFTLDCGLIYIKARENMFVGQQVSFHQADVFVGRRTLLWSLPVAVLAAAAAILVLLFATGVFAGLTSNPLDHTVAYVAVDINPSVELQVDADGHIVGVNTLNDDARKLITGMHLQGGTVNAAVAQLINASIAQGYLDQQDGLVMVSATVNGKNAAVMGDVSQYQSKLQNILQQITDSQGNRVVTLLIADPDTKVMADKNGLSIGRELLREFALKNNIDLTDDELRSGKISYLLNKIGCDNPEDLNPSPSPSDSETPSPSDSTEPTHNDTPSPNDTPKPSSTTPDSGVRVNVSGSGVKVSWDKAAESDGFQYYKVVASKSNGSPKYPADGYAKAISNIKTTSAVLGADASYSGGDIGGHFVPGQKYYFSVTYVYSDHSLYGNTASVTWPQPGNPTPTPDAGDFSPHMGASQTDDGVRVSWTKLPADSVTYGGETYSDFQYYKVVASKSDSSPKYPDNGYADAISNRSTGSKTLNPGDGYNGGDVGCFEAGQSYYFSVTYVFGNGKLYANAVRVTMPDTCEPTCTSTDTPTDTPDLPTFSGPSMNASVSGGRLHVSWASVPDEQFIYNGKEYGFCYYKIVASETVSNPKYPAQGYIEAISNLSSHAWSCAVPDCDLKAGHSYYISVTYYCDGGYLYANTVHVSIPADEPSPSPSSCPTPSEDPCPSDGE